MTLVGEASDGSPRPAPQPGIGNHAQPVLTVRGLSVDVAHPDGPVRLVDDVSFEIGRGEVLGIVGESGSGKSLTVLAIMGLLAPRVRVSAGEILLNGRDLLRLSSAQLAAIRGRELGMIFQDPMTSLNPVITIGKQISEAIRIHHPELSEAAIRSRAIELLANVGVPTPERRYGQYPHEFSGGMRQRAMIAIAMANEPALLIADEPTTALDVTIQAQVMEVLAEARKRTGASMILITHDLGLVAGTADRVAVMYGGRLVELADLEELFADSRHPYTVGLMASLPRLDTPLTEELYSIPGQPPGPEARPSGCVFNPRCRLRQGRAICVETQPPLTAVRPRHFAACHFADETPAWARASKPGSPL